MSTLKKFVTEAEFTEALIKFNDNLIDNNGLLTEGYEEVDSEIKPSFLNKCGSFISSRAVGLGLFTYIGLLIAVSLKLV